MRVLVTGGAGFIGSHVVDAFVAHGDEVEVLDCSRYEYDEDISAFHLLDVNCCAATLIAKGSYDAICHLAADPGDGMNAPEITAETHLRGMMGVCKGAADSSKKPRIIFASSAAVYGNAEHVPTPENSGRLPLTPYGMGKVFAEFWGRWCARNYGFSLISLRLANVFGPRQRPDAGVIARWCTALVRRKPIVLTGSFAAARDFVFVRDIANVVLGAARCSPEALPIRGVNIGTGAPRTLEDVAERLRGLAGLDRVVVEKRAAIIPAPLVSSLEYGEAWRLGHYPSADFDAQLAETYAWYAERAK